MPPRMILLAALLALAACGSSTDRPALAYPKGEWRQLNVGRWDFDSNQIAVPAPGAAVATGIGGV